MVATGDCDGLLMLWHWNGDRWDGEQLWRNEDLDKPSKSIAMSGDDNLIVMVIIYYRKPSRVIALEYDGSQRLETRESALPVEPEEVKSVVFCDQRQRIITRSKNTVRTWDKVDGEWTCSHSLEHGRPISSVAVSGDGRRIVSGGDEKSVAVWVEDGCTCKLVQRLFG